MSLLSDLFTEMDQYRFVLGHMKTLFSVRSYLDNVDIGNIIYTLLKCVSILGIVSSRQFYYFNTICKCFNLFSDTFYVFARIVAVLDVGMSRDQYSVNA